ncbi:MAG: DUF92 domain-containing protein [Spirochaetia bacterium]
MTLPVLIGIGLVLNAAAALVVLWRGSLDPGGAAAGVIVGTLIFVCGGPLFWFVLMAFFVSSTALGYMGRNKKEPLKKIHQKRGRRDMFQVLANGGVGALCALFYKLTGNPAWAIGFAVSFASSNSDTWASELGVLSRRQPVSLLTFRPVLRGVSGGVSILGTAMALAGALFIALVFALENFSLGVVPNGFLRITVFVAAGGFVGSLLDSFLGATIQAQYEVRVGGQESEQAPMMAPALTELRADACGRPNRLARGLSFVNNDLVNFASCALATLLGVLLAPLVL